MVYDSRALELQDWLAQQDVLTAEGWEVIPYLPRQSVVFIRKPQPDLSYHASRVIKEN
jgi:hypothetical protein